MLIVTKGLHVLAAVVWVGGMFFAYVVLRPAAGGVEAVYSALALHNQTIPPTINYEAPDPECDLDYVPNTARRSPIRAVLSNSFGFGGTNACLVFRQWKGQDNSREQQNNE